jgi:uncharacterized membrane protein
MNIFKKITVIALVITGMIIAVIARKGYWFIISLIVSLLAGKFFPLPLLHGAMANMLSGFVVFLVLWIIHCFMSVTSILIISGNQARMNAKRAGLS